jgi:hypothetical protein
MDEIAHYYNVASPMYRCCLVWPKPAGQLSANVMMKPFFAAPLRCPLHHLIVY